MSVCGLVVNPSIPVATLATSPTFTTPSSKLLTTLSSLSIITSTTLSASLDWISRISIKLRSFLRLGRFITSPQATMSISGDMTPQRRTLIIVLSSVLGSLVLILIAVAIFFACRCRKRRTTFRNGGVTPIDDEEIESWRVNEPKQQSPIPDSKSPQTPRGPSIDSVALKQSPGWTWTGTPATVHAINLAGPSFPEPPPFVAKAPNSRIGLTDETIRGADPFISLPKRQGSRLSKAPPGHSRTKSRRSSTSAKSVKSIKSEKSNGAHIRQGSGAPIWESNGAAVRESKSKERVRTWGEPDNDSIGTGLRDTDYTNSSPGTSLFDGLNNVGGLSPRPKSKSQLKPWQNTEDIGRAITSPDPDVQRI